MGRDGGQQTSSSLLGTVMKVGPVGWGWDRSFESVFKRSIMLTLKFEEHPEILGELGVILDSKEGVKVPSASVGTLWMLREGLRIVAKLKLRPSIPVWLSMGTAGPPVEVQAEKLDRICLFGLVGLCVSMCVSSTAHGLSLTHTHKCHPVIKMPGSSMRSVFALDSSSASSSH